MKIAVSILTSNYSEEESIRRINETDAEYLHVDVLDGTFVPEVKSYEFLHTSKKPLNVHLMVSRPFDYIVKFKNLNAESVTIQAELEDDLHSLLGYIKELGMKCGLALSPDTPVDILNDYLNILDEVLVLSVYPGKGMQSMIESTLDKVKLLDELRHTKGYHYQIFVDGGVNDKTVAKVGPADAVIVGSYICKSDNYQDAIDKIRGFKN